MSWVTCSLWSLCFDCLSCWWCITRLRILKKFTRTAMKMFYFSVQVSTLNSWIISQSHGTRSVTFRHERGLSFLLLFYFSMVFCNVRLFGCFKQVSSRGEEGIIRKEKETNFIQKYHFHREANFGERNSLLLSRVTPADSATYKCEISANVGSKNKESRVLLMVKGKFWILCYSSFKKHFMTYLFPWLLFLLIMFLFIHIRTSNTLFREDFIHLNVQLTISEFKQLQHLLKEKKNKELQLDTPPPTSTTN